MLSAEVFRILESILSDRNRRNELILQFEDLVDQPSPSFMDGLPEALQEQLMTLSYDLSYYEANPRILKEEGMLFGDDELERVVSEALTALRAAASTDRDPRRGCSDTKTGGSENT